MLNSISRLAREMQQFIKEQKAVIRNTIANLDVDTLVHTEVTTEPTQQQWLAKEYVKTVISAAKHQKLRFAHCYLYKRKGGVGTMKASAVHGIDTSQECIDQSHEYISDLRPEIKRGEDPQTYQYVGCERTGSMVQVVGGFKVTLDLPHSGKGEVPVPVLCWLVCN